MTQLKDLLSLCMSNEQACGLIIGKGGERINTLREQTQCKIQMQSKDKAVPGVNERTVACQGNLLQCQMAVEQIARIMFEDGTVQYENQSTNYGMAAMQASVGGLGGAAGLGAAAGLGGMYGGVMGGGLGIDLQTLAGLSGQGLQAGGMGLGAELAGSAGILSFSLPVFCLPACLILCLRMVTYPLLEKGPLCANHHAPSNDHRVTV